MDSDSEMSDSSIFFAEEDTFSLILPQNAYDTTNVSGPNTGFYTKFIFQPLNKSPSMVEYAIQESATVDAYAQESAMIESTESQIPQSDADMGIVEESSSPMQIDNTQEDAQDVQRSTPESESNYSYST